MCGLFSYFGHRSFSTKSVLTALRHRGPDSEGIWQKPVADKQLSLIHTRLAILDLSPAGYQPMLDPKTGNVIIFNGEIYNFLELKQQLEATGARFQSSSDTEVLLVGYRVWGTNLLAKLDGMFAFILYDQTQQKLLIARDHVGIKPLYYAYIEGGGIAFASEVRTLINSGLVEPKCDRQAIYDYLVYGSVQEPHTIRQAIKAFPPAHYAYLDLQSQYAPKLCPQQYWSLTNFAKESSENFQPYFHHEALQQAINHQLIADVPVGLFLSAGLDSTALATLISPMTRDRLSCYTLVLPDSTEDESKLAEITAKQLGLKHYSVQLSNNTTHQWLEDSLKAMDQPSSDGTNTYLISRASRSYGVTVVLSGCGADEIHGGYPHFRQISQLYKFGQWTNWIDKSFFIASANLLMRAVKKHDQIFTERMHLLLQQLHSPVGMGQERRRFFTPTQIQEIWSEGSQFQPTIIPRDTFKTQLDSESYIAVAEIMGYLKNTLLRDSDWATMANQQELRVPYLSRQYMETTMAIPWKWKRATMENNKPLIASQITSSNYHRITKRKKTGFNVDYISYITNSMQEHLHAAADYLNQEQGFQIDSNQLLKQLQINQDMRQARRTWSLLTLGFYLQHN